MSQWQKDELTNTKQFTVLTSRNLCLESRIRAFFSVMPLTDASVLQQRGELGILHILLYKYPSDIYFTQWSSGAELLGSHFNPFVFTHC